MRTVTKQVLMTSKSPAKADKLTEAIVEDNQQFIQGQQQRMQVCNNFNDALSFQLVNRKRSR